MKKLMAVAAAALVVAVVAGAGVWYFVLRNDSPPAVSLQAALDSVSGSNQAGADVADLEGTWSIVQGANSFVGYRVDETLANFGAFTAVGRTQSVSGDLEFDGEVISDVKITADVSTLVSDKDMRDNAIKRQALESATYPTATFVLTEPIEIDDVPDEGQTLSKTVTGELTLHGQTREIELKIDGVLQNGQMLLVGSTEIKFADFGIAQPVSQAVISIEDHGIMEFQLLWTKSA